LLVADHVNHNPATPDQPAGAEGVREVVNMFRSAMPDLKVVVEDMIAEGDKVVVRYTLEGTHEGELFGVAPTGRRLASRASRSSGCLRASFGNTGVSPTAWT
jgi:predicted ester cyclase